MEACFSSFRSVPTFFGININAVDLADAFTFKDIKMWVRDVYLCFDFKDIQRKEKIFKNIHHHRTSSPSPSKFVFDRQGVKFYTFYVTLGSFLLWHPRWLCVVFSYMEWKGESDLYGNNPWNFTLVQNFVMCYIGKRKFVLCRYENFVFEIRSYIKL